jgi:CDP-6-deoxy-D-xylo-4-hexulose-3-dehydrase
MKFPLMRNNILRSDLDRVIEYLAQDDPILTHNKNVAAFESEWSKWLDVKYSVFVNSGASANLLTMAILKILHPAGGEIIVPPLTWVSDISSVIQNGFIPIFADIDPTTLGMDSSEIIKKITPNTKAVFLTHAQGFNAITDDLLVFLKEKGIPLIEDVCESHGALHHNSKLGSIGLISNFSFYYAHHMSTIEGGMICTNDESIYQMARMLRGHGLVRESNNPSLKAKYIADNPDLNPEFIFAYPSYNVRNTEIGGILGLSQLPRLDENCIRRTQNLRLFLEHINPNTFQTNFKLEGSSNYAFNLIIKAPDFDFTNKLMHALSQNGVEFRRGSAGGGNQLRQPYLKPYVPPKHYLDFPNTEHIHNFGFYLGNYPDLRENEIIEMVKIINSVK